MTTARKPPRRTAPSATRAKHRRAKPHPVKATLPPGMPPPSLDLPATSPGFLISGIGASAGGLEAMEELRVWVREGTGAAKVPRERFPDPHPLVRGAR